MTHFLRIRLITTIAVTALGLAGASGAAAGGVPIAIKPAGVAAQVGLQDDRLVYATDVPRRMAVLADAGASVVRVDLRWDLVAKSRPANPTNPADPAYDWRQYDAVVTAAAANKIEVLFAVYGTPAWAADPTVAAGTRFPATSIRPKDAVDFGAFGEAAARRYSPRGVTKWEGWNEPNIALFLRPQYERRGSEWVAVSPETYAKMLTAFSAGVKKVDPGAVIAGAVTAPAGDRCPCDSEPVRVTPDDFVRALNAPGLRPPMDVVSHHPYPVRPPSDSTPSGRTYVDLYNLAVFERTIDSTYLAGKRLWITEYGFATETTPEYPIVFNRAQQAAFITDAYRRFQLNPRVTLTTYYLLQDHPGWRSGLLTQAETAKPGYTSFVLPFAVMGADRVSAGSRVTVRGQVRNASGKVRVAIQRRVGSRWVRIARITTSRDGSFKLTMRPSATVRLRAQWSGQTRSGRAVLRTSPAIKVRVR